MSRLRAVLLGVAVLALTGAMIALAFAREQRQPPDVAQPASARGGQAPAATARTDRWIALRRAPLERTEVGTARVGRFIYVIGGFSRTGSATTDAVERYDTRSNRWRTVRPMPAALNHSQAAAHRGRLYVFGGYTARSGLSGESAALFRYDPGSDRWSRLRAAPTARGAHAMGVIGDRLYVVGGVGDGRALDSLEIFDFRARRWSRGPSLPTAREHLAATVAGGYLYALAGRVAGQGNLAVAERYNPRRRRWKRLPAMTKPRGGIAAATVGGRIVVFGGEEAAGTIREVEQYDPDRRRWSRLPDMRTPRHGLGGASLGRRVYAVEGGPTPGFDFSNAIEALDVPR